VYYLSKRRQAHTWESFFNTVVRVVLENANTPRLRVRVRLGFRLGFRLELGLGLGLRLGLGERLGLGLKIQNYTNYSIEKAIPLIPPLTTFVNQRCIDKWASAHIWSSVS